ncbi:MAG: hypothetical protein IJ678_06365 [Kiritimatiellae bacterium]|nr:hypothetical protein [Kiritimatiellia bacterium]
MDVRSRLICSNLSVAAVLLSFFHAQTLGAEFRAFSFLVAPFAYREALKGSLAFVSVHDNAPYPVKQLYLNLMRRHYGILVALAAETGFRMCHIHQSGHTMALLPMFGFLLGTLFSEETGFFLVNTSTCPKGSVLYVFNSCFFLYMAFLLGSAWVS